MRSLVGGPVLAQRAPSEGLGQGRDRLSLLPERAPSEGRSMGHSQGALLARGGRARRECGRQGVRGVGG